MKDFFVTVLLKVLVDLIPGLLFTFATIATMNINIVVGIFMYIIAYSGLNLHTYLINKYDLNK